MDKAKWTSLCRRRNFLALVLGFGGLAQQDIRPAAQAMARAAEEACAQHG